MLFPQPLKVSKIRNDDFTMTFQITTVTTISSLNWIKTRSKEQIEFLYL